MAHWQSVVKREDSLANTWKRLGRVDLENCTNTLQIRYKLKGSIVANLKSAENDIITIIIIIIVTIITIIIII